MAHEEYKEMLPALALSALDAEDALALNQHLSECDECRRELAGWESTAAALALSASPAEPSPQVRTRIMDAVRSDKGAPAREAQEAPRVVPFPLSTRAAWTSFGKVGAIAAAVLCLVLILWIIVLWQQNRALRRDMDALMTEFRSVQEDARRSDEFVGILNSPGAKVARLRGNGPGAGANAQLVYDSSGHAMLIANDLPRAPAGKEYQLWYIVGKNPPIPGGTFAPDYVGRGELTDRVPDQALDSAVFAVTLEPAGGSTAPTSAIYLRSGL
jgi:anti-sigma-K factor RskA